MREIRRINLLFLRETKEESSKRCSELAIPRFVLFFKEDNKNFTRENSTIFQDFFSTFLQFVTSNLSARMNPQRFLIRACNCDHPSISFSSRVRLQLRARELIALVVHTISLAYNRARRNYKSSGFDLEIRCVARSGKKLRRSWNFPNTCDHISLSLSPLSFSLLCFSMLVSKPDIFALEAGRDFIFHFSPAVVQREYKSVEAIFVVITLFPHALEIILSPSLFLSCHLRFSRPR